jgi:tetrahydromethanopterin S-methyltransferase subunit G
MEGVSFQLFANIIFGVVSFLGGWVLKIVFSGIKELKGEVEDLRNGRRDDYRELSERLHDVALSMPEKFVSKDDFNVFSERMIDRFDRIDHKLDSMGKK